MRHLFYLTISILCFLTSCREEESAFVYDPSIPYPIINSGDFWPDKFDQRGLQNATLYRDRIFCNTIDVGGNSNFLYCLNPTNGLAVWHKNIKAYASQPVSFCGDKIIYCSYLGDISLFNYGGDLIWQTKFKHPYGGHWVDTINSRLLVKTVYWKNVSIYDLKSGALISDDENDSLQRQITFKIKNTIATQKLEYQFVNKGENYKIKCSPVETGGYKIEVINVNNR
jgi:hypothetical protein